MTQPIASLLTFSQPAVAANNDANHLSDLPVELIAEIFSKLKGQDIPHFELTCQQFYTLSRSRFNHGHLCVAYHAMGSVLEPAIKALVAEAEKTQFETAAEAFLQHKMKEFYPLFKRVFFEKAIDTNSDEFCVHAVSVQNRIFRLSNAKTLPADQPMVRAAMILITEFQKGALVDSAEAYASQPLEQITIDSYKEKVTWLQPLLSLLDGMDIEGALRRAILRRHTIHDLAQLSLAFTEAEDGSALFVATQEDMRGKLHAKARILVKEADDLSDSEKENKADARGKLAKVIAIFEQPGGLANETRNEMAKLARFYAELTREVKESRKGVSFRRMHRIID